MKEYIEREAVIKYLEKYADGYSYIETPTESAIADIKAIPAADVVEVRQIQAFIDKLIAERDKYDLHSMRWEHYDCDRLLIEQMLDEIDGERKGGDKSEHW